MNRLVIVWLVLVALAARLEARGEASTPWLRDLDRGMAEADRSGRDVLILFTGLGWCAPCVVMHREVFEQPEFDTVASPDFVLVELDFSFGDTPEEREREAAYRRLQDRYLVQAFPTLVLTDVRGTPYAVLEGYVRGTGPEAVLSSMRSARAARERRDDLFALAASATGPERAGHLHAGIEAIAGRVGSPRKGGEDPLLVFYGRQIDEIIRSDSSDGTLRGHYEARRASRDEQLSHRDQFSKLVELRQAEDHQGALRYIEQMLPTADNPEVRWRLETARQSILEQARRNRDALDNARRLLATDLDLAQRERMLDREAFNLFQIGRIEDGLDHYDRRIAAAADPDKRVRLLGWKADMAASRVAPELVIELYSAYRDAADRRSEDWGRATVLLGRHHQRQQKYRRALDLFTEFLSTRQVSWVVLDAAECHIALRERSEALDLLVRAEAMAETLRKSERVSDHREADAITDRVASLRARLDGDRE